MDFSRIVEASKLPVLVGIIVNIVFGLLSNGTPLLLGSGQAAAGGSTTILSFPILLVIAATLFLISLVFNFALYLYAGYRAGKKYGASAVEGCIVGAGSFALVHICFSIVDLIIMILILGVTIQQSASSSPLPLAFMGALQLGSALISFVVVFIGGLVVNGALSGLAAYFVTKK